MLWNSSSWSRLKLTVQVQLAFHPCDPFLLHNRDMIGNIVEKQCFAVWNVIQNVLLTSKPNICCFCLIICVIFADPSNKPIIYGPQLLSLKPCIQLFISIERKFFGSILFQNKSQRRGIL